MLRKLLKSKKAQNTAEYAILISLVVAGIIAMQTYAQRALQARVRDATQFMAAETNAIGTETQYEPYYLNTAYNVARDEEVSQFLSNTQTTSFENSDRLRTGGSTTTYSGLNSY